jgi:hypothetical protein
MRTAWQLALLLIPAAVLSAQQIEREVFHSVKNIPIAGARVRLQHIRDEPLFAKTDAQGKFLFKGLAREHYSVQVQWTGMFGMLMPPVRLASTCGST